MTKIIRETYKKHGNIDIDSLFIEDKNSKINKDKEKEVFCGSQVCLIY